MRSVTRLLILAIGSFLCASATGCSDSDWVEGGAHIATVRDITLPDTIRSSDPLTILLSADLTQPTGLPTFSHIETTRSEHNLRITVWADVELWRGSGPMPPTDLTVLEDYQHVESPPFPEGSFDVEFTQPFGDPLVMTVTISGA